MPHNLTFSLTLILSVVMSYLVRTRIEPSHPAAFCVENQNLGKLRQACSNKISSKPL